ncbi:hypothetical protein IC229_01735 [Spirosoma sp. BT702]|uniref:Uncharacterized protein n=1 Tax=Spirosoma profusum TaxID=2771354 RepID=A0A926XTD2_9BACT|nr:hypothetical protein [Spirosoma profusum]MBD2699339.1 hypothetical protein [Spirosoma profusum]
MRTLTKHLLAALAGITFMASCSRPVAYFQPSARENFKSVPATTVAVAAPSENEVVQPATENVSAQPAESATQVTQVKQAVDQVEAYVRNDNQLASNKKLTKRMARLNEMVAAASDKATVSTNAVSTTKKLSLTERIMLKKIDKKIQKHVAPEKTKAMNSNVRIGLIVGIIGLLLWLLGAGSVLSLIGLIGFVVGLVLILLGVING